MDNPDVPPEYEIAKAKAKIKDGCLRFVTTLLIVGIFVVLVQMSVSPINIYIAIGFLALGMVYVGEWITKLIYGAGPIYAPETNKPEDKE